MRKVLSLIVCLFLIVSANVVFAEDEKNPTGTIVSEELLKNRYEAVDEAEKKPHPEAVQKLLDQGTITAIQDARLSDQKAATGK